MKKTYSEQELLSIAKMATEFKKARKALGMDISFVEATKMVLKMIEEAKNL